jgi:hypothetical protein
LAVSLALFILAFQPKFYGLSNKTNPAQEVLESRVGAQRVEAWAEEDTRIKSLFIASFEPSHCLILIAEGLTNLADSFVEPVIEIDKGVNRVSASVPPTPHFIRHERLVYRPD